jgi:hypothetical protein
VHSLCHHHLYVLAQQIVSISNPLSCRWCFLTNTYVIVSGKVSKVSEQAITEGSLLAFYHGEWTDDGDRVRSMTQCCSMTGSEIDHGLGRTRLPEGPVPRFSNGERDNE